MPDFVPIDAINDVDLRPPLAVTSAGCSVSANVPSEMTTLRTTSSCAACWPASGK